MNDEKDLKSEENLTEEGNSVENESVEKTLDSVESESNDEEKTLDSVESESNEEEKTLDSVESEDVGSTSGEETPKESLLNEAKRFSDRFGDKGALDVILELDKKVEELWRKVF
jgi:hypothetical protein